MTDRRNYNRPSDSSRSYHPYRSKNDRARHNGHTNRLNNSFSRPNSIAEALETDHVLSIDQFASIERLVGDEITPAYKEYIKKHQKTFLLKYIFLRHRKEKWFQKAVSNCCDKEGSSELASQDLSFPNGLSLQYLNQFNFKREETGDSVSTESYVLPVDAEIPEPLRALLQSPFEKEIITMSNIPPYVEPEALENHIRELTPNFTLDMTCPNVEKGFYRLAWLTLSKAPLEHSSGEAASSNTVASELVSKLEARGSIEGAKIYFGISSSSVRRFKVSTIVAEMEQAAYTAAIKLISAFAAQNGKMVDLESLLLNSLDKAILYLRRQHKYCFLCGQHFSSPLEMAFKCGDLHLHRNESGDREEAKRSFERLIERNSALATFIQCLSGYGNALNEQKDCDEALIDSLITESSIVRVEEGKYRCSHCTKAFKGPDFVLKHLKSKHEDVMLQATADASKFSVLLANCPLWLFPSGMVPRFTQVKPTFQARNNGRGNESVCSGSSSQSSSSRYVDWDAVNTASGLEISYDL